MRGYERIEWPFIDTYRYERAYLVCEGCTWIQNIDSGYNEIKRIQMDNKCEIVISRDTELDIMENSTGYLHWIIVWITDFEVDKKKIERINKIKNLTDNERDLKEDKVNK